MWCRFRNCVGSGGERLLRVRKQAMSFSTASMEPKKVFLSSVGITTLGVGIVGAAYSFKSEGEGDDRFKFGVEDLRSEKAQWALYERWCKRYSMMISDDDNKQRGFKRFKERAFEVFELNSTDISLKGDLAPPPRYFADEVEDARVKMKAAGTLEDSTIACGICFKHFSETDPSMVVGCKHRFHEECLFRWACDSSECVLCSLPLSLKDPTSQEFNEEEWDRDEVLQTLLGKEEGDEWTPLDMGTRVFASNVLGYKRYKKERGRLLK